jgi:hypothetical protein
MSPASLPTSGLDLHLDLRFRQWLPKPRQAVRRSEELIDPSPANLFAQQGLEELRPQEAASLGLPSQAPWQA